MIVYDKARSHTKALDCILYLCKFRHLTNFSVITLSMYVYTEIIKILKKQYKSKIVKYNYSNKILVFSVNNGERKIKVLKKGRNICTQKILSAVVNGIGHQVYYKVYYKMLNP